jgi:2-dehydropantoate 2-reductase
MRFVIFGAGAVGGVVGSRLHRSGFDVILIARGEHYRAILSHGLTLEEPVRTSVLRLPVFERPSEVQWSGDEIVLLTIKSQDTSAAVDVLSAVAPSVNLVCMQNGVVNERIALRRLPRVYGAMVMAPAAHLEPGAVQVYGTELAGIVDIGRYPNGIDACCRTLHEALVSSGFSSEIRPDIMRLKYGKLVLNLVNAVEAFCEPGVAADELSAAAQDEGRQVLVAAGIDFVADVMAEVSDRWSAVGLQQIPGQEREGSSTWQSLARGAPSIETYYLNGEIVLLGRLHGASTPVNEALCEFAEVALRQGPGKVPAAEVLRRAMELSSAD